MYSQFKFEHRQKGVALATALLILIMIVLLGLAATRSARVGLRMAQNEETRVEASESAQSLVDATLNQSSNTPIQLGVTFRRCYIFPGDSDRSAPQNVPFSCDTSLDEAVDFPDGLLTDSGYVEVLRVEPEEVALPRSMATSSSNYNGALFEVTAGYDRSLDGFSAAEIKQRNILLKPKISGLTIDSGN